MEKSELLNIAILPGPDGQVRESTLTETRTAMNELIKVAGDIDYQRVQHGHGERLLQACLDRGNTPATAAKKLKHVKRVFQLAVDRGQLKENLLRRARVASQQSLADDFVACPF